MSKRLLLLAISSLLSCAVSAVSAAPITITYTFDGSPGDQASEPVDANPVGGTASNITRGSGIIANAGANSINSRAWTTAASLDANDYYEWTVTPDVGYELDISSLAVTSRRSATGPDDFQLWYSFDGFATSVFLGGFGYGGTENIRFEVLSLGTPFIEDAVMPVTFRLFGYGASSSAGTYRLGIDIGEAGATTLPNNLQIVGDLNPIPEPGTLALLGLGLAGLAATRRRKQ